MLRLTFALLLMMIVAYAAPVRASACDSVDGLSFICGVEKPEDIKHIPGTRWLVASGFSTGAGLKLIDTRSKTMARWFEARAEQIELDAARFPECDAPPSPALFNARGLSLRMHSARRGTLHVINHGGRESVEVFDITLTRGRPSLTWRGCLMLPPAHVGNAVATYGDGTVLVTVLTRPGTTITDFERGLPTGGVFERKPGATNFALIPGTELPGNNGLETARDDRGFYAIAFGWRSVAVFERGATGGPRARIAAPGFMPDNIHWSGGRLIAAGMMAEEPACGGVRQIINGVADTMKCPRGYRVAALDPETQRWTIIASGARNAAFNGVSSSVQIGSTLWLGSYQTDRIAWRPIDGGRSRARAKRP